MILRFFFIALVLVPSLIAQQKEYGKIHEPTSLVYPPSRHAPIHKATAIHLYTFMALIGRTDIKPDDPSGIAVTRLKSTDDPKSKTDDDDLTVYGLNTGQNNVLFNSSMQSLDVYEGKGRKQKLNKPRGIAANANGDVYIADTGNNRIVKLLNPGNYLTFVDAYGQHGKKPGEFDEPRGIALDQNGRVFVSDANNDRIQVFDAQMNFQYAIGDHSDTADVSRQLYHPETIALTDAAEEGSYFKESFLIVVDLNNTRLRKYTLDGQFIAGMNSTDYGYQQVYLTSAAIDFYGNVWVTDMFNHCVHKFDKDLRFITSFGHIGDGDNEFFEPRAIGIWKRLGQVFIVDKKSAQYYHIGTDIYNMEVSRQDSSIRFDFFLTEISKVSASILDDKGRTIARLVNNQTLQQGTNSLLWDRIERPINSSFFFNRFKKDSTQASSDSAATQKTFPSGLYKLKIEARTTYIYSRYFTKTVELEFAF
ncbi:hypothetical protein K1X84_16665 [bacterium]|nr:hypothetical protein [bacterium]